MSHHMGAIKLLYYRLLWLLVVLGSTTLLTIMTIENIKKLQSNPKTVSVDVQYWDQLPFPAVTICNQNQIRSVSFS